MTYGNYIPTLEIQEEPHSILLPSGHALRLKNDTPIKNSTYKIRKFHVLGQNGWEENTTDTFYLELDGKLLKLKVFLLPEFSTLLAHTYYSSFIV